MKITHANIYILNIPFHTSFNHFLKSRCCSDSIVVELITDNGVYGYGEGIARPYVTGETVAQCINNLQHVILPAVFEKFSFTNSPEDILSSIHNFLLNELNKPAVCQASRCAIELALLDCFLRDRKKSLNSILPSIGNQNISYSGVFSATGIHETTELAYRFKNMGLKAVKIKVNPNNPHERIAKVREIMGQQVSIRLDANGAFSPQEAINFLHSVASRYRIRAIEQPVPRDDIEGMAEVTANSPVTVIADESLVTVDDAQKLIAHKACDCFNLRIAKCGGLYNLLKIAELAARHGIKIQLGCLVGETAILSAIGRQLAAHLPDLQYLEGSFSTLLMIDDISHEEITFGKEGKAALLTHRGLGTNISTIKLRKYSRAIISVSSKHQDEKLMKVS